MVTNNVLRHTATLLAAAALIGVFGAGTSSAQVLPSTASAPGQPVQPGELEEFVSAFYELEQLGGRLEIALRTVQDPHVAMQLQRDTRQAMARALDAHGLTPDRYTQIMGQIVLDDELRADFEEMYLKVRTDGLPSHHH